MKANQFIKSEASEDRNTIGVSAVIGVILMLAITVAIASVTYYYANGMVATESNVAPKIGFMPKTNTHELTVVSVSGDYSWADFTITNSTGTDLITTLPSGTVKAGDIVSCDNSTTLTLVYMDKTLCGEFKI